MFTQSLSHVVVILTLFDIPSDPQVLPLIEQMGSPKYREREAATEALALLGKRALPYLKGATQHSDCEIAARARRLIERYYAVMPTNYQRLPWIDMMPENSKATQKAYLDKTGWSPFCRHGNDWPSYRYATYLWSRDLLNMGMRREMVVATLDKMAQREMDYRGRHGMPP